MKKINMFFSCLLVSILGSPLPVWAALTMSGVQSTDVTPSTFSVVWQTSESASPAIKIYTDSDGTIEITDQFEVTFFPLIGGDPAVNGEYAKDRQEASYQALLQSKGVMKVGVTGLNPETTYYYQIFSIGSTETVAWPTTVPFQAVTTARETGFVSEANAALLTVSDASANGMLVVASTAAARYGISAFVGDGAAADQAFLNLANFYTPSGDSFMPASNQDIIFTFYGEADLIFSRNINLTMTGNFAVANIQPLIAGVDTNAAITMQEPVDNRHTTGLPILLSWDDTANGVNGQISLYRDTDGTGQDGVLIASGISEDPDGPGDQYQWDVAGVPDGTYYIYAILNDGMTSVSSYATGTVTKEILEGDANGDGKVDIADAILLLKIVTRMPGSTPINLAADINGDGQLSLADCLYVLRALAFGGP